MQGEHIKDGAVKDTYLSLCANLLSLGKIKQYLLKPFYGIKAAFLGAEYEASLASKYNQSKGVDTKNIAKELDMTLVANAPTEEKSPAKTVEQVNPNPIQTVHDVTLANTVRNFSP